MAPEPSGKSVNGSRSASGGSIGPRSTTRGVAASARVGAAGEAVLVAEVEQRLADLHVLVVDLLVLTETELLAELGLDLFARLLGVAGST